MKAPVCPAGDWDSGLDDRAEGKGCVPRLCVEGLRVKFREQAGARRQMLWA